MARVSLCRARPYRLTGVRGRASRPIWSPACALPQHLACLYSRLRQIWAGFIRLGSWPPPLVRLHHILNPVDLPPPAYTDIAIVSTKEPRRARRGPIYWCRLCVREGSNPLSTDGVFAIGHSPPYPVRPVALCAPRRRGFIRKERVDRLPAGDPFPAAGTGPGCAASRCRA